MPESKRRKKNKKPTAESKRRQGALARQNRRNIREIQGMLADLETFGPEYLDYTKFKKENDG